MNETIRTMLQHRSIREFTDHKVEADKLAALNGVAQRTSSSQGLQMTSIIRVTAPEKRGAISQVCKQEYVARAPELWIFLVDNYRNVAIAREKGSEPGLPYGMDLFFGGFSDACLTAQNVLTAAESMGMGGVFLGSILNNPARIIEILGLPEGTFPALGLIFGYPGQEPELKPRMAMDFRLFENSYRPEEDYLTVLADYDKEMATYYDLRNTNRRVDCFSDQCVSRMANINDRRNNILEDVEKNGYQLFYVKEDE